MGEMEDCNIQDQEQGQFDPIDSDAFLSEGQDGEVEVEERLIDGSRAVIRWGGPGLEGSPGR